MTTLQPIFARGRSALYEKHRYSAAIRAGDLLIVAGQVGSRDDGSPEPDFERQVGRAFDTLRATLEAAGCGFEDVVDVTSFHTDPERHFETVLRFKDRDFPAPPYPAWTAVGVDWLAGFDFEIKAIARVPGGRESTARDCMAIGGRVASRQSRRYASSSRSRRPSSCSCP